MKYRLGIDLGTSSLGLAAYELDENDNIKNLAYIDEVIFREPIKPDKMITLNSERRSKRLARRQQARYVKRIKKVIHVLKLLGVTKQDMQKLEKRDVFELRVRALREKITIPEFAKVILHVAKHRGYKGDLSEGTVSKNIEVTEKLMTDKTKTLSEVWLERKKEAEKTGEAWVKISESGTFIHRKDVEDEFYKIFDKQAEFYPELNKVFPLTNENFFPDLIGKNEATYREMLFSSIFYQRPIKWKLETVGKCRFEDNEYRASTAQTVFQKYRIAKVLKDLRIINKKTKEERTLTIDERQKAFDNICDSIEQYDKENGTLSKTMLAAKLNVDEKLYKFNLAYIEDASVRGLKCLTSEKVFYNFNVLDDWRKLSEIQQEMVLEFFTNITKYIDIQENSDISIKSQIWELTKNINGKTEADKEKVFEFVKLLKDKEIYKESGFKIENKRSNYSVKALKKLTEAHLIDDRPEYDIIQELYPKSSEKRYVLRSIDEIKIGNPVIDRALVQLERSLKFAIQKLGGNPYEIVIELSREMKQSLAKRNETQTRNNNTEKKRLEAVKELNSFGIVATPGNIEKQLLWQELQEFNGGRCPYCGVELGSGKVFSGNTQIDHIIPQGQGGANIYSNKVLCCNSCNLEKGKRTPYLWSNASDLIKYETVTLDFAKKLAEKAYANRKNSTVDMYHGTNTLTAKANNLKTKESLDNLLDDFAERQNAQTAWIGRIVLEWTKDICDRVYASQGQLTAYMREELGLATLLPEIRIAEGKDIYNLEDKVIDKKLWEKLFKGHCNLDYLDKEILDTEEWKLQSKIRTAYEAYQKYREEQTPNLSSSNEELWNDFISDLLHSSELMYNKRCDHRHHIVDACTIGLCTYHLIAEANRWTGKNGGLRLKKKYTGEKKKFDVANLTDFSLRNELKKRLMNYTVWHKPDHYPAGNLFKELAYNMKEIEGKKRLIIRKDVETLLKDKDKKVEWFNKSIYSKTMKKLLAEAKKNKQTEVYFRGKKVKNVLVISANSYRENLDKKIEIANKNNPDKPHVKYYQNEGYACCDFDKKNGRRINVIPQHVYEQIKNQPIPDNVIRVYANDIIYDKKTKQFYVVKIFKERDGMFMREVTDAIIQITVESVDIETNKIKTTKQDNLVNRGSFKDLVLIRNRQDIAKIKKGQF